ncbi:MAG: hypothetical protein H8D42_06165 [Candidatus Marinimicrobia bacterium]|nr:hypothetical protein [Candidatus Neomarinimicrobiota bacterium]
MKKSFLIIVGLAAMLLFAPACLEDFFSTDEEEDLSQDLVGIWHRIYMTINGVQYGLPSVVYLNDDGSGTGDGFDELEQEEPEHNVFSWKTYGNIMIVTDENDSIIWSGGYTLLEDNNVVQFNYTSGGHDYQEMYVKYTGEKDAALIGDWALVELKSDGERQLMLEKVTFVANGSGEDYLVEDLEDTTDVETSNFNWTTTGSYLIVISEGDQYAMVIKYSVSEDVLTGTSYGMEGTTETYTFVKDVGEHDPAGIGTWIASSWKINGVETPMIFQATLVLNTDWSGSWTTVTLYGTFTDNFTWTTNNGYVFIYLVDDTEIAWVQSYEITENTMVLTSNTEYVEGYGWVTVEYTLTKSS